MIYSAGVDDDAVVNSEGIIILTLTSHDIKGDPTTTHQLALTSDAASKLYRQLETALGVVYVTVEE